MYIDEVFAPAGQVCKNIHRDVPSRASYFFFCYINLKTRFVALCLTKPTLILNKLQKNFFQ